MYVFILSPHTHTLCKESTETPRRTIRFSFRQFSGLRQPVASAAGLPSNVTNFRASYVPSSGPGSSRSQTDLAGRQAAAVEYLLQQPEYQLVDPQLLRILRVRAVAAVPQPGHRVRATPSQKFAGVLRADERHDRPERAEVPGLLPGVQVELADIEERQEIDHASPPHEEPALREPDDFALSGRIRGARAHDGGGGGNRTPV